MNCPTCNCADNAPQAKFCEECGSALSRSATGESKVQADRHGLRCANCGAGPSATDDSGFCTQCGNRRRKPERDHFEDLLSSKVAGVSDIGMKYHENQDYFALGKAPAGELVLVVCDGVSRSQNPMDGSKRSSDVAREHLIEELSKGCENPDEALKQALLAAQEAICQVPFTSGATDKAGDPLPPAQATIVSAIVKDRRISIGWVGDSRAYWVSDSSARQLTTDHSWVNEVVAAGEMSLVEAQSHKNARAITQSLGADMDGSNPGVKPDALTLNLSERGVLLIVSDGFYQYADNAKISSLLKEMPKGTDALTISRRLVEFARQAGGHDNITVVAAIF